MARPSSIAWAAVLALLAAGATAQNRIAFNNQQLFLNGLNLAWDDFANDIGPDPGTPDTGHFSSVFQQMETNGANAMRLWLHTNGAHTPAWNGPLVTGPGDHTLADLQTILDLAWDHHIGMVLCLWSFDMLRTSYGSTVTGRAAAILTNQICRTSYIDNSLVPMVEALAGHPAVIAWEIFNEPEGMSDEFGWPFTQHVPMSDIQAFINQCAGAIHRTDPAAKVTNGSWSFLATTDVGSGNFNYYTDARLIAAGGDHDGFLDFYTVHYYDWAGTTRSPFHHPASYWDLDKPLAVAEFFPDCNYCGSAPYENLYQNGYAGALAWSWTDADPADMLAHIAALSAAHPEDVLITTNDHPAVIRMEAEDAVYGGEVTQRASGAASNGAYLDMRNSGTITWTLPAVPAAGDYDMTFRYNLAYDTPKEQYLLVNGGSSSVLSFVDAQTNTWLVKTIAVPLNYGVNTVTIEKYWGWMYFDYLELAIDVQVLDPVVIQAISVAGGEVLVQADGPAGPDYTLLSSTNLADWQVVGTVTSPVPPVFLADDLSAGVGPQFYSVELGP